MICCIRKINLQSSPQLAGSGHYLSKANLAKLLAICVRHVYVAPNGLLVVHLAAATGIASMQHCGVVSGTVRSASCSYSCVMERYFARHITMWLFVLLQLL
jgi:hypothetical protein